MSLKIEKFDLVVALYVFGVMVAELLGSKTFPLLQTDWLHLNASVAIFVMPLLFTLTDVVVEVHGRSRARSMVFSGLITVALLMLFSLLATHLPPSSRFAVSEPAYDAIFGASARIAAASLAAFAVSELLDVAVFSKLRARLGKRGLWLRNNVSNFVSQLADSAVFLTLAFYAFGDSLGQNASFLFGLLLPYWLIRCGLSLVETPLVYLGVWWLKGDKKPALQKATAG
jgi:uncharacterized integral membrane protein (TIGR00697 family)